MSTGVLPVVTLFERAGCHLCEEAAAGLEGLRSHSAFELRRVDIESDRALEDRYAFEIPVIAVDGQEITRAPVDLQAVVRRLQGLRSAP